MKKIENVKIAVHELNANKLRTALTMLGIIFGVGAVIAMLSIGEGARQETLDQIKLMGTNNIIINATRVKNDQQEKEKGTFSKGLNLQDCASIAKLNPYVDRVVPQREYNARLINKTKIGEVTVIGTTPDYPTTYNQSLSYGRFFVQNHLDNYSNVCVIGAGVKSKFFKYDNPVGKEIKLNDSWFRIIGVIQKKIVSSSTIEEYGIRDFNQDVYIPFTTLTNKMFNYEPSSGGNGGNFYYFGGEQKVSVIDRSSVVRATIKVNDDSKLNAAAKLTRLILERRHNGVKDFEIIIPEELLAQKQKTQRIFNVVMGAIAGISLLVGGIGIMNIMLANIMERTKEIGIRRAVGASRQDVLNQFIYEAIIISVLGGLLGIVTGFLLTKMITTYAEWKTIITPYSVILAFFVSVAVGLVFGIYPAKQAADKDPIESLRYE